MSEGWRERCGPRMHAHTHTHAARAARARADTYVRVPSLCPHKGRVRGGKPSTSPRIGLVYLFGLRSESQIFCPTIHGQRRPSGQKHETNPLPGAVSGTSSRRGGGRGGALQPGLTPVPPPAGPAQAPVSARHVG